MMCLYSVAALFLNANSPSGRFHYNSSEFQVLHYPYDCELIDLIYTQFRLLSYLPTLICMPRIIGSFFNTHTSQRFFSQFRSLVEMKSELNKCALQTQCNFASPAWIRDSPAKRCLFHDLLYRVALYSPRSRLFTLFILPATKKHHYTEIHGE